MIFCPNKNSKEFKKLVSSVGENRAYFLWNKYKGEVPKSVYSNIKEGVENLFENNPELFKIGTQQLYSQYIESLNKPNTNPVLKGNQQEQVKKFAELQERLNNKEFLEGAKNAFESSKGLQEWGTQEQYNDYIARVSLGIVKNPTSGGYNYDSKIKDIIYHGTDKKFNKFDDSKRGSTDSGLYGKAHYFSKSKEVAYEFYGRKNKKPLLNI